MSKFSQKNFFKSFGCAMHGLALAVKSQKNFSRQLAIAAAVVIAAFMLNFNIVEFCIVLMLISMVLVCEMFNSVIEFTIDAVVKNRFSKLAAMAKDMAAGAVCIASLSACVVGGMLFANKIFGAVL